jgi:hypothetical protein
MAMLKQAMESKAIENTSETQQSQVSDSFSKNRLEGPPTNEFQRSIP